MEGILGKEKGEFWKWVLSLCLEVEMIPVKWGELNGKAGSEEGIVVLFGFVSGIGEEKWKGEGIDGEKRKEGVWQFGVV